MMIASDFFGMALSYVVNMITACSKYEKYVKTPREIHGAFMYKY